MLVIFFKKSTSVLVIQRENLLHYLIILVSNYTIQKGEKNIGSRVKRSGISAQILPPNSQ